MKNRDKETILFADLNLKNRYIRAAIKKRKIIKLSTLNLFSIVSL
jgi:hypothetical protein